MTEHMWGVSFILKCTRSGGVYVFGLARQLLKAFRERSWTTGGRLRADCLGQSGPRGAQPCLPLQPPSPGTDRAWSGVRTL